MLPVVAECNVIYSDLTFYRRQNYGIGFTVHRLFQVKHGKNSVNRRHSLLHSAINSRQSFHGICQIYRVCQKSDKWTRRHNAVNDFVAAEPYDKRNAERGKKFYRRRQATCQLCIFHWRLKVQFIFHAETFYFVFFAYKRFHNSDWRNTFLQKGRYVRHFFLNQRTCAFYLPAENFHGVADHWHGDKRQ